MLITLVLYLLVFVLGLVIGVHIGLADQANAEAQVGSDWWHFPARPPE